MKNVIRSVFVRTRKILKENIGIKPEINEDVLFIGSSYGGWGVIGNRLGVESVVLSFGIGEDASFDLGLIEKYGCKILAFDPTPRSAKWVKENISTSKFKLVDKAVSGKKGVIELYLPRDVSHVSASSSSSKHLSEIAIPVQSVNLAGIIREYELTRIDLLKMDIEGSEYEVIPDICKLKSRLMPRQLLVEFHHNFSGIPKKRTKDSLKMLSSLGYKVAWVSKSLREVLFIRKNHDTQRTEM